MLNDEQIIDLAKTCGAQQYGPLTINFTFKNDALLHFVRAIEAAARAEQHAECVRLLREEGRNEGAMWDAMVWLESQKP